MAKVVPSVFDQAVVSGTSFATSIVLGRLCTPGDVGIYFLALSVVMFLIAIQGELISGPYAVFCHGRNEASLARYGGSTLVHQAVFSLGSLLAVLVFAGALYLGFGSQTLLPATLALGVAMPLLLLRAFARNATLAHLRMKSLVLLDVTVCSVQLVGFAVLIWFGVLGVTTALSVMAGACLIGCAGWWLMGEFRVSLCLRSAWADWRHNWKLARWSLASELLGSTTPYLLPWMLAAAHGTAATGMLAICTTLVGLSNCFLLGISNYLIPRAAAAFTQEGVEALRDVVAKSLLLVVATLGVFCCIFCLAGEWIATTIYGPEYAGGGSIIAVLAISLVGTGISTVLGNGLYAMQQQRINLLADACILVVTLVGAWLLIAPWGALGVAVAMLAGIATGTVVRCLSIQRLMRQMERAAAPAGGAA